MSEGYIGVYRHHDGKAVTMIRLNCQTDFCARSPEFRKFADDLARHCHAVVFAPEPKLDVEFFNQTFITSDPGSVTVEQKFQEMIDLLKEPITMTNMTNLAV